MPSHFRLKFLVAALTMAAATSVYASPVSVHSNLINNGQSFVALTSHATLLHAGDKVVGPLTVAQPMHVIMSLNLRNKAKLDAVAHSALAAMAILLTWRTALYTLEAHENGEVSTLLLVPLWIPVALMLPSLLLLVLAALSQAHDAARFPTATQGGHA